MLEPVRAEGGSLMFVQLNCARHELLRRVQNGSRRALDKLVDPDQLTALMERFDLCATAPVESHLCLDVTHLSRAETANTIIEHYALRVR